WDRGLYYTRSRKVAGRVVREYVGGGEVGRLAAAQDALERQVRDAERARQQAERDGLSALAGLTDDLDRLSDQLATAALESLGYRKHKGQWRKRRDRPSRCA